ncbi:hypothetical protein S7711_02315 [Stachybotrys chartarum IBT 7711]|uniref:Protein kinase domain-containing protein n=1 Tax=Stachybotrys chartarum (strain CBS 109288 / IBT 7711) TaxID=1280523 RepID=A0A084B0X5_STACB|nr:hypothetical protein S7711_02315 [Stachybotrys chartarum IBT 7711]KFA56428.1 hypothetical protein S40293_05013 [Stachybotrys chartarum IBT 40293]KFA71174.1 hypothetical protein S40288_04694 [Stachybotrys chartarum IBT 40288]
MNNEENTGSHHTTSLRTLYHPLQRSGQISTLYKLHDEVRGYTLVAKAVGNPHRPTLAHEEATYGVLDSLQGKHIPVCLGVVELASPLTQKVCIEDTQYTLVYRYMLLLSFAGFGLDHAEATVDVTTIGGSVDVAFHAIHELGVLHNDPGHNIVCDGNGKIMVIDFERSQWYDPVAANPLVVGRLPSGGDTVWLDFSDERIMARWKAEDRVKLRGRVASDKEEWIPISTWD